jgi:hypothetical protein
LNDPPRSKRRRALLLPALLVAAVAGLAAWWRHKPAEEAPTPDSEIAAAEPAAPPPAPAAPREPPRAPASTPAAHASPKDPYGELPVAPGGEHPDGGITQPMNPHPITPRHQRIQEENRFIGALNGAVDAKDGPGLRRILAMYKDEYPDDPNQLQEGYRIIADCLEHPGAASRAAGQRYDDEERGSILRLFVERSCLGAE